MDQAAIEELKRKKELYIRDSGGFIPEWIESLERDLGLQRFADEEKEAEMVIKILNMVLDDFITNLEKQYI